LKLHKILHRTDVNDVSGWLVKKTNYRISERFLKMNQKIRQNNMSAALQVVAYPVSILTSFLLRAVLPNIPLLRVVSA
jgi:hypothetical protein